MKEIHLIDQNSTFYPKGFCALKNPPDLFYATGNLSLLQQDIIAIVGARKCAKESICITKQLVKGLSPYPLVIASGMADGIDQIVHQACLENALPTIAMIAFGHKEAQKNPFFQKILQKEGLILSEYFPDTTARQFSFPRRNQLLVALSKGVIAVETHLKGGTMITAQEALQQQVPLFTFPGGMFDSHYEGNNFLLTKGAICINSYEDFLYEFQKKYPQKHWQKQPQPVASSLIPAEYQAIYSLLEKAPQSVNFLAQKLHLPIQEVQGKLFLMELHDWVQKMPHDCYVKK